MNWIRRLFGLCEHRWESIGVVNVFDVPPNGKKYDGQDPSYAKMVLSCKKCGDVKVVII